MFCFNLFVGILYVTTQIALRCTHGKHMIYVIIFIKTFQIKYTTTWQCSIPECMPSGLVWPQCEPESNPSNTSRHNRCYLATAATAVSIQNV